MDEALVNELRRWNLYPLELDIDLKILYSSMGFDPSSVETHYTPGTPRRRQERYIKITDLVWELYDLENRGQEDTKFYRMKEEQIRTLLFELTYPPLEEVLEKVSKRGPVTGVIGVFRDLPAIE